MIRFEQVVTNQNGTFLPGVSVAVNIANATPGTGAAASLFSDEGTTSTGNPVTSDSNGRIVFYVVDGKYDLTFSGVGITTYIRAAIEIADMTGNTFAGDSAGKFNTLTVVGTATLGGLSVSGTVTLGSVSSGGVLVTGITGLPASGATNLFIGSGFGTPNTARLYIGDGTGWQINFSKRAASVTTDLITVKDNGSILFNTTTGTLPASIQNDAAGGISVTNNSGQTNRLIDASGNMYVGQGKALLIFGVTSGSTALVATATAGSTTLTLPAVTDTIAVLGAAQTLVATRLNPRSTALATSTTFTPNSDTTDIATMNMTGTAGTLTIAAPTGTPVDGQKLLIRIKATNAQTYSFNATYHFSTTVTAPTSITATKTDYIGCIWNATNTAWEVVAVDQGH